MKCKQHPCDLSSSVGVCASCLRHRLLAIIAAQSQLHHHHQSSSSPYHLPRSHSRPPAPPSGQLPRKSDSSQHPLVFPRSVSPYVARRKSHDHRGGGDYDDADLDSWSHHHNLRFHTTPQLAPTYSSSSASSCQRKYAKLSLFANLFRSRSDKLRNPDPESAAAQPSSSSSSSWLSSILPGRRKKQSTAMESLGPLPPPRRRGRGMSPADCELAQDCDRTPSGGGDVWELKRTPTSVRRGKGRGSNNGGNSNATGAAAGFAFCLSPLVRASPNRHWNQKSGSLAPDLGEVRVAVKPNLSMAASYCANRSRKLADFGRATNHTR